MSAGLVGDGLVWGARGLVWIDGVVGPLEGATVPLEDRGMVFADGVYEVLRVYDGQVFALSDHLTRFERSAAGIRLALPKTPDEVAAIAQDLVSQTGLANAEVYLQLTRGAARRNHLFPDVPPRLIIWARPLRVVEPALWQQGGKAIVLADDRWARCDLKTIALLPNVLAKQAAHEAGATEALLIRDGQLTEGATSNVFLVRAGELVTPVADRRILAGITRLHVLRLAQALELPICVRDVDAQELAFAEEVFITNTTLEILGIRGIDDRPVGNGAVGPVTRTLAAALSKEARSGRV